MKRLIALLLSVAVLLGFVSCSGADEKESDSDNKVGVEEEKQTDNLGFVTEEESAEVPSAVFNETVPEEKDDSTDSENETVEEKPKDNLNFSTEAEAVEGLTRIFKESVADKDVERLASIMSDYSHLAIISEMVEEEELGKSLNELTAFELSEIYINDIFQIIEEGDDLLYSRDFFLELATEVEKIDKSEYSEEIDYMLKEQGTSIEEEGLPEIYSITEVGMDVAFSKATGECCFYISIAVVNEGGKWRVAPLGIGRTQVVQSEPIVLQ